jgi:hypothetical protein
MTPANLWETRQAVFAKMVELVAQQEEANLEDPNVLEQIEQEVDEAAENWEMDDVMIETPIQQLLAEYHKLGAQMLRFLDKTASALCASS